MPKPMMADPRGAGSHPTVRSSVGETPDSGNGLTGGGSQGSGLARSTDPVTSHAAAETVDLSGSQDLVVAILEKVGPSADHDLVSWADFFGTAGARLRRYSHQRLRTARRELQRLGRVRDSGKTALTDSGRDAIVWELVTEDVSA